MASSPIHHPCHLPSPAPTCTPHRSVFRHPFGQTHLGFPNTLHIALSDKRNLLSCFAHATMAPQICREKTSGIILPAHAPYQDQVTKEVLQTLDEWSKEEILPFLKPVETMWQPQDLLPDPGMDDFLDKVHALREQANPLPDEYIVCLVGNTITEEALPTYQSSMYRFLSSSSDDRESSWATWARSWTAEENRHGDLLNKYLYLSGKVDMRMIEKTIHYLIHSGMDVGLEDNPYLGFIYTSFQERATFISHGNIARQAKEFGDVKLAKICGSIAADEKRHERAYTKVVQKLLEIDPDGIMLALEEMMRKKIVMPAHLMYDGEDENLFDHFSSVAQRIGVYTSKDYANNLEHFLNKWAVDKVRLTTSRGRAAQDYVCGLLSRIRRLEERAECRAATRKKSPKSHQFSWIFNRQVML